MNLLCDASFRASIDAQPVGRWPQHGGATGALQMKGEKMRKTHVETSWNCRILGISHL